MADKNTIIGHVALLVHDLSSNKPLYKELFSYFDYIIVNDESWVLGVQAPNNISLWIMEASEKTTNHRDANGMNHLAFHVSSQEEVDEFVEDFLVPNNITPLFDTPRARTDFTGDKGMYYQVMFELPGSILFEVVYTTY